MSIRSFASLTVAGLFSLALSAAPAQVTPASGEQLTPLPPEDFSNVDCKKLRSMGLEKQVNLRAGILQEICGTGPAGGSIIRYAAPYLGGIQSLPTAIGGGDVNVVTGGETWPHVTQSESFVWGEGNTVVVNYNDSRQAPGGYSGVSYSTDGGATFTRILPSPFNSGHGTNYGDPIVLYNKKLATWFAGDLATGCGGQGIGLWTSTNGITWTTGSCAHSGSADDRESFWVDNNSGSPYYGRMYISWNNFAAGQGIFCVYSDNGTTWTQSSVVGTFIRNVQITGSSGTDGTVFIAGMNEGGGSGANRTNIIYRSVNGGASWTAVTMGAPFGAPGQSCPGGGYFWMIPPIWRHMGWGQPAVGPANTVHYDYCGRGVNSGDSADVFYTRSTDNGATWSTPIVLNTDQAGGGTQAQWMPSLTATAAGQVLATWYDRRNTSNGTNYEYWGRMSMDGGQTWQADQVISDVLITQPAQPDPSVQSCYAGDYNYITTQGSSAYITWTDGRNQVNGTNQQDVYFDQAAFCAAITISPLTLPNGTRGVPYSQMFTATGGTGPYTWAVTAGTLPPGMTLSTGGLLSGTPTSGGTFNFTVTVTDSTGCPASNSFTLIINCPAITLAPATLPNGTKGFAYNQTITASGGIAPYTFAVTTGTLPPGLTLSTAGLLSGTPTTNGTYPFTVTATDAGACAGSQAYTIVVSCPTITLSPATLPNGILGQAYNQTITATGGTAPYTFAVTVGTLPPGLTLSTGGILSGTPTIVGNYSFTVQATDSVACTGSQAYTVSVNCPGMSIIPATLPGATVGLPYNQTLTASGGNPPYTFAITAGALPPGITLSTTGLLSGTPTAGGSFGFTVTVTDAVACTVSQAYTLNVVDHVDVIVGEGCGAPNPNRVRVFTQGGSATAVDFLAYSAGTYGVKVTDGNIDGGAYGEIITGPGPGRVFGSQVRGFDRQGSPLGKVNLFAYGTLRYGVHIGDPDLDNDGVDEILTGAGPGAVYGPHVRAFNYDGVKISAIQRISFYAYKTLGYGVNVTGGALDSDAFSEILTGPGPGPVLRPTVRGFNYDGFALTAIGKINFNAFPTTGYGAEVAAGDFDNDGFDEIAAGQGPSSSLSNQFRGFNYDGASIGALPGFTVTAFTTMYGGIPSSGDIKPFGGDDLICAAGPDPAAASTVSSYEYTGTALSLLPGSFTPFSSGYGVNIAAGGLGY